MLRKLIWKILDLLQITYPQSLLKWMSPRCSLKIFLKVKVSHLFRSKQSEWLINLKHHSLSLEHLKTLTITFHTVLKESLTLILQKLYNLRKMWSKARASTYRLLTFWTESISSRINRISNCHHHQTLQVRRLQKLSRHLKNNIPCNQCLISTHNRKKSSFRFLKQLRLWVLRIRHKLSSIVWTKYQKKSKSDSILSLGLHTDEVSKNP